MSELNFLASIHTSTKRDYVQRVVEFNKAQCAEIAQQWGYDYWDGDRQYGFGGYSYDGRWRVVAGEIATHYNLKSGDRILDIGCGKAFLLYEFTQVVPGIEVTGIDISEYGIKNAKEEIRDQLKISNCTDLTFEDNSFDFVYSLNTFHNLSIFDLHKAIFEMVRVAKDKSYICIESYRNEYEKMNLLYWQLTCKSFYSPDEWQWIYDNIGYKGDTGFIYFE
jgi:ubiquinone/menaquinone biosynthesis C-methylase UbiE